MSEEIINPLTVDGGLSSDNGMDDIDKILSAYKDKAEFSPVSGSPQTTDNSRPSTVDGGQNQSTPFSISHEPYKATQEVYKRGAKKGQPKPPKKGTAPPLNPSGQLSIQATTFIGKRK